jgi:Protein of unknown function (DUF2523)
MYGILVSAARFLLGWLLRGVVVKFVILSAIYYVITFIVEGVLSQLDISPLTGLQTLLDTLPSGMLYFMGVFRFDVGLPLILGAMLTGFVIRRLPIIG